MKKENIFLIIVFILSMLVISTCKAQVKDSSLSTIQKINIPGVTTPIINIWFDRNLYIGVKYKGVIKIYNLDSLEYKINKSELLLKELLDNKQKVKLKP